MLMSHEMITPVFAPVNLGSTANVVSQAADICESCGMLLSP